jgi:hypothetical protein
MKTVSLDIPQGAAERVRLAEAAQLRPSQLEALLLGVARILRARLMEEILDPSGNNQSDYKDLCDLLAPFDPSPADPQNHAST